MKLDHLLLEDRASFIADQMNSALIQRYQQDTGKQAEAREIVNQLMKADPTQQSKYLSWITKMYVQGQFKITDLTNVKHEVAEFERIRSKLEVKDISQYQSLQQLTQAMAPHATTDVPGNTVGDNKNRDRMYAESDVIHKGSDFALLSPRTVEAAKYFGRGTSWSIASGEGEAFADYNREAPVYILVDNKGEKFQLFFPKPESDDFEVEVLDAKGGKASLPQLFAKYKGLKAIVSEKTAFKDWANPGNAETAMWYAYNILKGRYEEGEAAIAKDGWYAAQYADQVIKGRFIEAEPAIVKDPYAAIQYSQKVLKARWPAAEANVMRNPHAAVMYAQYVIKGRWPEAEASIKSHPEDAAKYQEAVLHGAEWPEEDTRHTGKAEKKEKAE